MDVSLYSDHDMYYYYLTPIAIFPTLAPIAILLLLLSHSYYCLAPVTILLLSLQWLLFSVLLLCCSVVVILNLIPVTTDYILSLLIKPNSPVFCHESD